MRHVAFDWPSLSEPIAEIAGLHIRTPVAAVRCSASVNISVQFRFVDPGSLILSTRPPNSNRQTCGRRMPGYLTSVRDGAVHQRPSKRPAARHPDRFSRTGRTRVVRASRGRGDRARSSVAAGGGRRRRCDLAGDGDLKARPLRRATDGASHYSNGDQRPFHRQRRVP